MILDDILPSYLFLMLIIPGSIHIGVHFLFLFLDDLFCSLFWKEMNMGSEKSHTEF